MVELICQTLTTLEESGSCTMAGQVDVRAQFLNRHRPSAVEGQDGWRNKFRLQTPHQTHSSLCPAGECYRTWVKVTRWLRDADFLASIQVLFLL